MKYTEMMNPFFSEEAQSYCYELMRLLDENRCLDFFLPPQQRSACFATDLLFEPNGGQMFGILVCKKKNTPFPTVLEGDSLRDFTAMQAVFCDGRPQTKDLIILKAFSGQFAGNWNISGWVPPLLDTEIYNKIVCTDNPAIQELTCRIKNLQCDPVLQKKLVNERAKLSRESLAKIYALYRFFCADGSIKTLADIDSNFLPTGTGDCCAPKLLNFAFANGLEPISLAEFYYGSQNASYSKEHKNFYPSCDTKCTQILPLMLGLDIVYTDAHIVVVNKSAGLLSVPGRGADKQDCVVNRLKRLYPNCIEQPAVHRLDMDTSGLMVLARTEKAHQNLSRQFENRRVQKRYIALLDGNFFAKNTSRSGRDNLTGQIKLAFRLDIDNRPHQIYDEVYGKIGITDYHVLGVKKNKGLSGTAKYHTRIEFTPLTGRTHQLRIHSAHKKGLGLPIVGDRLYGNASEYRNDNNYGTKKNRLMLHATFLAFNHPVTGKQILFERKIEF